MSTAMELRRRNLSQLISDELLERVRSGELKAGDHLPTEQGMMTEFGVGRNVVREAVQHLVALKVVDVRPRRGIVVTGLGPASALDALAVGALLDGNTVESLYSFRMLLETAVAEEAAKNADSEDLRCLDKRFETFRTAIDRGSGICAADVAFHQQLAEASGNIIFDRVLHELTGLLEMYRRRTDLVSGAPEKALIEHANILDAIKAQDPDSARDAMEIHIRSATTAIKAFTSTQEREPQDVQRK